MITNINSFRIINEALISNDSEYFKAVSLHYNDDLIETIKTGDMMAQMMCNSPIQTYKTDNGNTFIRYCENEQLLIILGAVSLTGKMNRDDLQDFNIWIDTCIDKINEYKTVMTSTNDLSKPILNRIIKKCKINNIELNINTLNEHTDPISGKVWTTYQIKKSN